MEWFSKVLPFLEPYPSWVKAIIAAWIMLSAVTAVALLVAYSPSPTSAESKKDAQKGTAAGVWLKIKRIELYRDRVPVRVTANINGNTFVYPGVGGIKWVETGPDMSPGIFKLPASDQYQITFSMESDGGPSFVSQRTVIVEKNQIPHSATYAVHTITPSGARAAPISADITYELSRDPN
jgi:hypothetical protein